MKRSGFQRKEPPPLKKPALTRKTPLRKQSPKRVAYRRSEAGKAGLAHMARVKGLGCLICGSHPVEFHHEGKPRNDLRGLPLCPEHHRREYGPGAYHYSPKAFYAMHGPSEALLGRVETMLDEHDGSRT